MIELMNAAKPVLLQLKLKYLKTLSLRLFKNDIEPRGTNTADDYVEADFPGYVAQDLSDFGRAYENRHGQGQADTCTHEWRMNAPSPANLVYGYFVTDPYGWLIFADRNPDGPVAMNRVDARYTLRINFLEDTLR
jgi:hypothetical protein